jgi:hypothetical protein
MEAYVRINTVTVDLVPPIPISFLIGINTQEEYNNWLFDSYWSCLHIRREWRPRQSY